MPLIESDDPYGAATVDAVRGYAKPLQDAGVDTVILGCTHYPLIRPILQRVFGRGVTLVFSAEETAREVAETLARKGIENAASRDGTYRFLTTGDPKTFRAMGARFLQLPIDDVEHVTLAELEAARMREGRRPNELRPLDVADRLPRAAARRGALVAGEDDRPLHGVDRGGRAALAPQLRPRLDDGRVLAAARVDGRPRRARGAARASRADGRSRSSASSAGRFAR